MACTLYLRSPVESYLKWLIYKIKNIVFKMVYFEYRNALGFAQENLPIRY